MNPEAILALLSDLYSQVAQLRAIVADREEQIAALTKGKDSE